MTQDGRELTLAILVAAEGTAAVLLRAGLKERVDNQQTRAFHFQTKGYVRTPTLTTPTSPTPASPNSRGNSTYLDRSTQPRSQKRGHLKRALQIPQRVFYISRTTLLRVSELTKGGEGGCFHLPHIVSSTFSIRFPSPLFPCLRFATPYFLSLSGDDGKSGEDQFMSR